MKCLDVVATSEAVPEERLEKGQVGTIVEELGRDMVLVEFSDCKGVCRVLAPVSVHKLVELRAAVVSDEDERYNDSDSARGAG